MTNEIAIPIVGLGGIVIGAILQYALASRRESTKHFQQIRTQAYVDFFDSVAQSTDPDFRKHHMADAKTRVAIYGSTEVITALANLLRTHGANINSPNAKRDFVNIVKLTRADTMSNATTVAQADIGQLIFGIDT